MKMINVDTAFTLSKGVIIAAAVLIKCTITNNNDIHNKILSVAGENNYETGENQIDVPIQSVVLLNRTFCLLYIRQCN